MEAEFREMSEIHRKGIIDIYNYFIENSLYAYPEEKVSYGHFDRFMEMTAGYPAFTIMKNDFVIGFCFLRPYNRFSTFNRCAEITYFIASDHTGAGLGKEALRRLEAGARGRGVQILLASISSENHRSIGFHLKNGFSECGCFRGIINKNGKTFDIIWMQKDIL